MKLRPARRILYCAHDLCRIGWTIDGIVPPICPNCGLSARWTTALPPRWSLSDYDVLLLTLYRIASS
jgi:hypothetical protein